MHLGIDTTQADQQVRGAVSLSNGIGTSKRVIEFCTEDKVVEALGGCLRRSARRNGRATSTTWFSLAASPWLRTEILLRCTTAGRTRASLWPPQASNKCWTGSNATRNNRFYALPNGKPPSVMR